MELRKDYLLDRYVIIATERGLRPHEFVKEKKPKKVALCYFCPGNEQLTPPAVLVVPQSNSKGNSKNRNDGKTEWQIRVFENKFPAVKLQGDPLLTNHDTFFTMADAYGRHEVVVETPDHETELADLRAYELRNVWDVYMERLKVLQKLPGIKYVMIFKNHGEEAGTSVVHTHTQIIAYNAVPQSIEKEEEAITKATKNSTKYPYCPYCEIIPVEKNSARACFENAHFVSFTPYASRSPFEIWIFPKRHTITPLDFSDEEKNDLCRMLRMILKKLKSLNAAYNYYLHYGLHRLHFHIEVIPRLTTWAGFELGTETIINPLPPEDAARFYRE